MGVFQWLQKHLGITDILHEQRRARRSNSNMYRSLKEHMDDKFLPLEAEINRLTTVSEGVSTLMNRLLDDLDEARNDPDEIAALTSRARESIDRIAAAVERGTAADTSGETAEEPTDPGTAEGDLTGDEGLEDETDGEDEAAEDPFSEEEDDPT